MNNFVKINYSGKEYIGQILAIESAWETGRNIYDGEYKQQLLYYRVDILEKDTDCEIGNIFVNSFDDIKPYKE